MYISRWNYTSSERGGSIHVVVAAYIARPYDPGNVPGTNSMIKHCINKHSNESKREGKRRAVVRCGDVYKREEIISLEFSFKFTIRTITS